MAARAQKLTPKTIEILNSAYVEGTSLRLTCGQLPARQFAQPKAVIEAVGGIWSAATGAYTFPYGADPSALLAAVLEAGTVPLAAKTAEGYVRTPDQVATDVLSAHVDVGHLPRGARVLEPSAGDGAIVREILREKGENPDVTVVAVEPHPDRVAALRVLAATVPGHLEVHACTLEEFAANQDAHGEPFDAVVMNPPFALPGNPDAWIPHVRTAYGLMYPGGQLAAIVPNSYTFHETPEYRSLRADVTASGGTFEALDRKAFGPSACGVLAGVLTWPRPMPAPADGRPVWLARELPAGDPVPVRELNVGASGAATMPVQIGRHLGQDGMVIRYAGQCFGCSRLLWSFDDRGGASVWEACHITADHAGKVGPAILACLDCFSSDAERYTRALATAAPYWTDQPADAPQIGPTVYPMDLGEGNWVTATGTDYRGQGWDRTVTGQLIDDPEIVESGPNYDQCADKVALTVRLPDNTWSTVYVDQDTHVCVFDGPPAPEDAARAAIKAAFTDAEQARTELRELHSAGVDRAGRLDRALAVERLEKHAHTVATAHLPAIPAEPVSTPDPAPFVSGWTQEALPLPV
jgi:predicted RNA methylase